MECYFAYGSNLHPRRLRARVPIAADLGVAALPGWRLVFHKRSVDGSAKCDIVPAGHADVVFGAVYLLDDAARAALDEIEGVGRGYRRARLALPRFGSADCYLAEPAWIEHALAPYDWYLDLVRAGARTRCFPAPYRQMLDRVRTMPDPDTARADAARRLVAD
ncbi:MAG: gamma-glutamylcyclotransferase family protein [Gammaproteobacteria bacterium]